MKIIANLLYLFNRQQRIKLSGILVMMTVGASLEAVGVGLILPFITMVQAPDRILRYVNPGAFFGRFHVLATMSAQQIIILLGLGLLTFYLLKNVYLAYSYSAQFRFVYALEVNLAERLLGSYLRQPYIFHLRKNSAELLKNVTIEVFQVFNQVLVPLLILSSEVIVAIFLLTTIFILDPFIAMSSVGILGGLAFVLFYVVRKKTNDLGKRHQHYYEQILKRINEALGGIKEIKILQREAFFLKIFRHNMEELAKTQCYPQIMNQLPRLFVETMMVMSLLMMVIVTQIRGQNLQQIMPTLALFGMAAYRLLPSINRILSMLTTIRYFKYSLDVVHKDLKAFPAIDLDSQKKSPSTSSQSPIFQREIRLTDISYLYPGSSRVAIENVNMVIEKGTSVAFVGPTGSGKTTLVDIILGLLTPSRGKVLIDDMDIRSNLQLWQGCIGYIPQAIFLADDTIRRNIAFGIPDGDIDEDKVWKALEAAQLHTLIRSLPGELETLVGERGVRLSGGERQRIGIARALYHQPEFLVMDEATASLDQETEKEVTRAVERLSHKFTLIVIAHRLSTVRNCDKIYRIHSGRCEGEVSYEQLKAVN